MDIHKLFYDMERPLKINFLHQTKLDEINDKLLTEYEIVESYKQMWQNAVANHISRKEKDELSDQLQEKLDKFHYDFLCGCQQIIEDITSQYTGAYQTKEVLYRLEKELENTLMNFSSNWKKYISSTKALKLLIESLSYEDISELRYPKYISFVVDNYSGEVTLNMAIIWRKVFNYLGMSNSEFIKEIDDNVVCN